MSMPRSAIIDSFRDRTESETVWLLRRAFIDRNWVLNADPGYKDHIVMLSRCFASMALGHNHDYPYHVMEEVGQRSLELLHDINKAKHEKKDQNAAAAATWSDQGSASSSSNGPTTNFYSNPNQAKHEKKDQNAFDQGRASSSSSIVPTANFYTKPNNANTNAMNVIPSSRITNFYSNLNNTNNSSTDALSSRIANFYSNPNNTNNASTDALSSRITSFYSNPNNNASTDACSSTSHKNTSYYFNSNNANVNHSHFKPSRNPSVNLDAIHNRRYDRQCVKERRANQTLSSVALIEDTSWQPSNKGDRPASSKAPVKGDPTKDNSMKKTLSNVNPQADSVQEEEDVSRQNMTKLSPILEMSDHYTKIMKKGSMDAYSALKICATKFKQKVKCISKAFVNADDKKEVSCQLFISDIYLTTVLVRGGTSPDDARTELAETAFKKICLPYIRLNSDDAGGLQLEGSQTPFDKEIADGEKGDKRKPCAPNEAVKVSAVGNSKETRTKNARRSQDGMHDVTKKLQGDMTSGKPISRDQTADPSLSTPQPAATQVLREFDSYLAWQVETNQSLKKVRQLGHMFQSLPYLYDNPAIILKCLLNVSDIELNFKPTQTSDRQTPRVYKVVMDGQLVLYSCKANSEDEATNLASGAVLRRVSMPYLCLRSNTLQASHKPFPQPTSAERIVYDRWQTECQNPTAKNLDPPIRLPRFYLTNGRHPSRHLILTKTAASHNKKLELRYYQDPAKGVRCVVVFDGHAIGQAFGEREAAKNEATLAGFNNLRRCHWLIVDEKPRRDNKKVSVADLAEYLPTSSTPETSGHNSNIKPVHVQQFQGDRIEDILHAYARFPGYRSLFIPSIHLNDSRKALDIAPSLNMHAKAPGKGLMKMLIVTKIVDPTTIFSQLLSAGGKSDMYQIVPPELMDADKGGETVTGNNINVAKTTVTKRVQCCLIEAPPLQKWKRTGMGVEMIYDLNSDSDRLSERGSDDNDNDCQMPGDEETGTAMDGGGIKVKPSRKRAAEDEMIYFPDF